MKYMKERDLEIARLYKQGMPLKQIAYKFGMHISNVSHIARQQGVVGRYDTLPVKYKLTIYVKHELVNWFKIHYGQRYGKAINKILQDFADKGPPNANPTLGRTSAKSDHELLRERY